MITEADIRELLAPGSPLRPIIIRVCMQALGAKGGRVPSERKQAAARANMAAINRRRAERAARG